MIHINKQTIREDIELHGQFTDEQIDSIVDYVDRQLTTNSKSIRRAALEEAAKVADDARSSFKTQFADGINYACDMIAKKIESLIEKEPGAVK